MADDLMRVRLTSDGMEFWRLHFTDAESGKLLPVMIDSDHAITLRERNGVLVVEAALVVDEIDIPAFISVRDLLARMQGGGG